MDDGVGGSSVANADADGFGEERKHPASPGESNHSSAAGHCVNKRAEGGGGGGDGVLAEAPRPFVDAQEHARKDA